MNKQLSCFDLFQELKKHDVTCSAWQIKQFELYFKLLLKTNKVMNLTSIVEQDEVYEKHFYDSVLPFLGKIDFDSICDVGSGAGFPSIPLKILYPHLKVCIVEPMIKRTRFLKDLCKLLNLKSVSIYAQRAENFALTHREAYDLVTARAVASLPILCELCIPLVKVDGYFVAMKGRQGKPEALLAENAITQLGGEVVELRENILSKQEIRINIRIKKISNTKIKYPRNYSQIKKNPL